MMEILKNETVIWGIMAVLVFLVTQGLKWILVKPYTSKISNNRTKKIINSIILIIAFGVSVLIEFLFSKYILNTPMNLSRALTGWSGSSLVYSWVERFLGKKIEDPLTTEEGKSTQEFIETVIEDNKLDKEDGDKVKEFWSKVNHE